MRDLDTPPKLALVIGINQYENGIAPLQTAANDARAIARLLKTQYQYETHLLLDQAAALIPLTTLLTQTLPQQITPQHHLLFYFAGHGIARDNEQGPVGYLIPQDARSDDESSFLPMQTVVAAIDALPCHHLLMIIDCCFAGAFRWACTRDIDLAPETLHKQRYDRYLKHPARQVITSAAHDQKALDLLRNNRDPQRDLQSDLQSDPQSSDAKLQHSPFAQGLLQALKGDGDLTKDGVIVASELYLWLNQYVASRSDDAQTPGLWPLKHHDRGEYLFLRAGFSRDRLQDAPILNPENNPYRGLQSYETHHSKLFFGRDALIQSLYQHLIAHPLTIVVGASGSGKSSLVKAGLVPYLQNASHIAQRKSFRETALVPEDWQILSPLRPGNDPLLALAQTLLPICNRAMLQPALDHLHRFQGTHKTLPPDFIQSWRNQAQNPVGKLVLILQWYSALRDRLQNIPELQKQLLSLDALEAQIQAIVQQIRDRLGPDLKNLLELLSDWLAAHPQSKFLLIVDQAEELITQVSQDSLRQTFLKALLQAQQAYPDRLFCLLTLRLDFEDLVQQRAAQDWKDAWPNARFVVPPMSSTDLREAIVGPANEAVLYFEPPELVDRIIQDLLQMPGALPLLSFTLSELYQKCFERFQAGEGDRALLESDYRQLGGVVGALRTRADAVFNALKNALKNPSEESQSSPSPAQQTLAKLMLRMVTSEGRELARRRVPRTELDYPDASENQRVEQVLQLLVQNRLLVFDKSGEGEFVEPAHDALVRNWEKIGEWLSEKVILHPGKKRGVRQDSYAIHETVPKFNLSLQQQVNAAARAWKSQAQSARRRSKYYLWTYDPRLGQLIKISRSEHSWLNALEKTFIQVSEAQKLKNYRIRAYLILSTMLSLGAASIWALQGQTQAVKEQINALGAKSEANLISGQTLDALVGSLNATSFSRNKVLDFSGDRQATELSTQAVLHRSYYSSYEVNRIEKANEREGHEYEIFKAVFSPDGRWVATTGYDGTVHLWTPEGGWIATSNLHQQNPEAQAASRQIYVPSAAFSPDSRWLATGDSDGQVLIWDMAQVKDVKPLDDAKQTLQLAFRINRAHDEPRPYQRAVRDLVFSAQGDRLATGGYDGFARIWDMKTLERLTSENKPITTTDAIAELQEQKEKVWGVDFSADGGILAIAYGGTRESGGTQKMSQGKTYLWDLATIDTKKSSRSRQTPSEQSAPQKSCIKHDGSVLGVKFNPRNPQQFATVGKDRKLNLWSLTRKSGELECRLEFTSEIHQSAIWGLDFSKSGQFLATSSTEGDVIVWSLDQQQEETTEPKPKVIEKVRLNGHRDTVWSVRFKPDDETTLVTASTDSTVRFWNWKEKAVQTILPAFQYPIRSLSQSSLPNSDRQYLALSGMDGVISVLQKKPQENAELYSSLTRCTGARNGIFDLQWIDPGKAILAVSGKGQLLQFGLNQSSCLKQNEWEINLDSSQLDVQAREAHSLAIHPRDRNLVVTSSGNGAIRLWDFQNPELVKQSQNPWPPIQAHEDSAWAIAFDPEGEKLATVGIDGMVRLWNFNALLKASETFAEAAQKSIIRRDQLDSLKASLGACRGHQSWVLGASFHPTGQYLATSDSGGSVRIWRILDSGELLCEPVVKIFANRGPIYSLEFSPDGQILAVADADSTVRLWDLSGKALGTFPGHTGVVWKLSFSADSKHLLATDASNVLRFWPIENTQQLIQKGCQQLQHYLGRQQKNQKIPACP